MKTYKIASIPGDGIGKEVIPECEKVLTALSKKHPEVAFDFERFCCFSLVLLRALVIAARGLGPVAIRIDSQLRHICPLFLKLALIEMSHDRFCRTAQQIRPGG